jgi:hypothetical protein
MPLFFNMLNHINPANAPMGVKNAPMFDPIIDAYTAPNPAPPPDITDENNTLIGMLFIKFAVNADTTPYTKIGACVPKVFAMPPVTPHLSNAHTAMNMVNKNGTNIHGVRFAVLKISVGRRCRIHAYNNAFVTKAPADTNAMYAISRPMYADTESNTVHTPNITKSSHNKTLSVISGGVTPRSVRVLPAADMGVASRFSVASIGFVIGARSCLRNNNAMTAYAVTTANTVGNHITRKYATKSNPAPVAKYMFVGLPIINNMLHVFAATKHATKYGIGLIFAPLQK